MSPSLLDFISILKIIIRIKRFDSATKRRCPREIRPAENLFSFLEHPHHLGYSLELWWLWRGRRNQPEPKTQPSECRNWIRNRNKISKYTFHLHRRAFVHSFSLLCALHADPWMDVTKRVYTFNANYTVFVQMRETVTTRISCTKVKALTHFRCLCHFVQHQLLHHPEHRKHEHREQRGRGTELSWTTEGERKKILVFQIIRYKLYLALAVFGWLVVVVVAVAVLPGPSSHALRFPQRNMRSISSCQRCRRWWRWRTRMKIRFVHKMANTIKVSWRGRAHMQNKMQFPQSQTQPSQKRIWVPVFNPNGKYVCVRCKRSNSPSPSTLSRHAYRLVNIDKMLVEYTHWARSLIAMCQHGWQSVNVKTDYTPLCSWGRLQNACQWQWTACVRIVFRSVCGCGGNELIAMNWSWCKNATHSIDSIEQADLLCSIDLDTARLAADETPFQTATRTHHRAMGNGIVPIVPHLMLSLHCIRFVPHAFFYCRRRVVAFVLVQFNKIIKLNFHANRLNETSTIKRNHPPDCGQRDSQWSQKCDESESAYNSNNQRSLIAFSINRNR